MPRIETTRHVPQAELEDKILKYKADPDYISHKATPEDLTGSLWTLEVIVND